MCEARTLNRHAALVSRMAETLGLDLTQATREGRLSADAWRDAVLACTGCADPGDCMIWLADRHEAGAEAPPDYCRNAGLMAELARVATQEVSDGTAG
ncbi:DUF6455 family protein [Frigidibacter mobilis]|uniref:DUF6455 domain-containing protein n=1 Tax=Frigidibacter mobilis TaxID=1335048 RepID=A0A159Z0J8_9RHOB|nr:DUF6455 family protein [Frigidibacter mobilis]AMY68436.1 hypothetical protein AKL17_1180 [Frigidibacter mobilis]